MTSAVPVPGTDAPGDRPPEGGHRPGHPDRAHRPSTPDGGHRPGPATGGGATEPGLGRSSLRHAFAALGERTYRWWFVSQVLSASGTMTQAVGQAWLLLRLTGSAVDLGALTAATFTPVLVLSAWAGSIVDRVSHRRLLLLTQSLFFGSSLALGVLVLSGAVRAWMVFAFAVAGGTVMAFDQPARQVFVLELVGTGRTGSAISLNEVVLNTSRVLGPAVGGALLATAGVGACFVVNAASFVPPFAVLVLLVKPGRLARAPARAASGHLRAGLSYSLRTPLVRATLLMAVASGMLFNMGVALPLMATRVFHMGGGAYGGMMAAFGVGAVVGAFTAAAGSVWPSARRVRLLCMATGLVVVAGAMAPAFGFLVAALVVAGFLSIWFIALANTMVQVRTTPDLRGRVMGVWTMALPGMNPLTGLLTGLVATALGARPAFAAAGVALFTAAVLGWRALSERGPRMIAA